MPGLGLILIAAAAIAFILLAAHLDKKIPAAEPEPVVEPQPQPEPAPVIAPAPAAAAPPAETGTSSGGTVPATA